MAKKYNRSPSTVKFLKRFPYLVEEIKQQRFKEQLKARLEKRIEEKKESRTHEFRE